MWKDIPADIFNLLCIYLSEDVYSLCSMSVVCKRYHTLSKDIWNELYKNLSDVPCKDPKERILEFTKAKDKFYMAADKGYEKAFKDIRKSNGCKSNGSTYISNIMQRAAYRGHLAIIKELYQSDKYMEYSNALNTAARHGHMEIVKYICSFHILIYPSILTQCFDQPDILEWLLCKYFRCSSISDNIYKQALLQGKVQALNLFERYTEPTRDLYFLIHKGAYYDGWKCTVKLDLPTIKWVAERDRRYFFNIISTHILYSNKQELIEYCYSIADNQEKLLLDKLVRKRDKFKNRA